MQKRAQNGKNDSLFKYKRTSYGFWNEAETFPRFIIEVYKKLNLNTLAYIEDLFKASENEEDRKQHL